MAPSPYDICGYANYPVAMPAQHSRTPGPRPSRPSAVAAPAQYDRSCRIVERRERETRGRSRERLRAELLDVARERHAYWMKGEAF